MGSKDDAPTWADQWGSGDDDGASAGNGNGKAGGDKKTVAGNVKAAALEGLFKAKAAALVGSHKVKSGTSSGIKWVKEQYQKRASSK